MAEQAAVGIAERAAGSLICPTWQEFQYLLNYNSNVKKLEKKVKDLECRKDAIKQQVDAAKRNAETIRPDVLNWFERVEEMKREADEVLERTDKEQIRCLFCECPYLYSRYTLSKEASKKTGDVIELENAGNFERVGNPAPPAEMPFTPPGESDSLESRTRIMNDVLEALKDDSITRIGICGMPGVGKTTLVEKIGDEVKASKFFDEVVLAVVSKDPKFEDVQNQLGESLGLRLENTTGHSRASRLYKRLMDTDNRVLIILDDLWQELDLHKIGIPERKGLKVLFTSRLIEVCNTMSAKPFEVKVLSGKEAWHLFQKTAEISKKSIEGIAKEVAKECRGLPLAIMTVGKALKNKKEHAWRDALQQLKKASVPSIRGMQDKVYSRIKWSYDYLDHDDSKKLLLICSLFPEDYEIPLEGLVNYAKGLQLFQEVETMAEARDRVCTITDELKSCYLLLEGRIIYKERVKLHDVVRDVCLSIASKGEQVYMVMHAGLKEWPQKESYAFYTCISLSFGREIHQLPSGLECPNLKLLRLTFPYQVQRVDMPEDFFREMKQLKVLQVENLESKVPSSLQLLVNLRTLWLTRCRLRGDISIIQSLNKLEILSFCYCRLESFPDNIMKVFKNLKLLDLRCRQAPPLDCLVSLEKLEELYLGELLDSKHVVDANKIMSSGGGAGGVFLSLKELRITNASKLQELFHGNLPRGSFAKLREVRLTNLPALRHLWGEVMLPNLETFKMPICSFAKLRDMEVRACHGLLHVAASDSIKFLQSVERVELSYCSSLEVVFDFKGLNVEAAHVQTPLGCLQTLTLSCLPSLKHIWRMLPEGIHAFANLRELHVNGCNNLRYLLSPSMAKVLVGLETLLIYECDRVEAIIGMEERAILEDGEEITNKIEFPKLRLLGVSELHNLRMLCSENIELELPLLTELVIRRCPRMTKFWAGHLSATSLKNVTFNPIKVSLDEFKSWMKVVLPNLERLHIGDVDDIGWMVDDQMPTCSLSKLRDMQVEHCNGLLHVAASDSIKFLRSVERVELSYCSSLEVVFDFKGLNVEAAHVSTPLGCLQTLRLSCLRSLKHICRMLPEGIHAFANLRKLHVDGCHNLRYLLSPSMAKVLVGLETLLIYGCDRVEAIIGMEERATSEDGEETANKIDFPKLKCLNVLRLDNLKMLCSENIDLRLPLLTELVIERCPRMTKFCAGHLSAARLNNVKFVSMSPKVSLDEFKSWMKDCELKIRCLNCSIEKVEECDHLH